MIAILCFERDDLHREIAREQGNGLSQQQKYDPAGRLLEQQISRTSPGAIESTTGIQRRYSYDKAGQLIGIGDSRRGNLSYRYDPVGRLLEANSRVGRETFAFDPAGNIVDPPATNDPLRHPANKLLDNLLKNYAGTSYRYDERGNMTERVRHGWRTVFAWDGFNRMTAATDQRGITTSFSYDALGRRLSKSSGEITTLFGWDGDVLAFESTQSKSAIEEGGEHGWSVHYIHEANSFVPLVQVRRASAMALSETTDAKALMEANGGVYDIEQDPLWNGEQRQVPRAFDRTEMAFYQCDHLGTPQELTDHEGSVAWSAQYKAWGEAREAISEAGRRAGFRNPARFQGQYWDEETGLHYNRYRYYDPQAGRFVSKDPIKLAGGNNIYQYAPNPIRWFDPLGLIKLGYDKNDKSWSTPNGLIYGQGSAHGNRIKHVLEHESPDANKSTHSVLCTCKRGGSLDLVDEAWAKGGQPLANDPGAYVIPMGRAVGTNGEKNIKLITRPGTNRVITAYPVN